MRDVNTLIVLLQDGNVTFVPVVATVNYVSLLSESDPARIMALVQRNAYRGYQIADVLGVTSAKKVIEITLDTKPSSNAEVINISPLGPRCYYCQANDDGTGWCVEMSCNLA